MKLKILMLLTAALLTGCSSVKQMPQPLPVVPIETNTNTKIIHTEIIDTVFIEIPAQSAEKTTPEGYSHLETDYAESDAQINPDGSLHHSLKNKSMKQPVPVKNSADTVYVDRAIEIPVPVEVPVAIERELTWWEKTRLNTWGWLAAVVVLRLVWICRKPIVTLARRLLTKKP